MLEPIKNKLSRGQRQPRAIRVGRNPGMKWHKPGDLLGEVGGVQVRFDPQVKKGSFWVYFGDAWTRMLF
jgi:hypothetical protein